MHDEVTWPQSLSVADASTAIARAASSLGTRSSGYSRRYFGIKLLNLFPGELVDGAAAVGSPIHIPIMHQDQRTIAGATDVHLYVVDALANGGTNGRQHVFRGHLRITAVRDNQRQKMPLP